MGVIPHVKLGFFTAKFEKRVEQTNAIGIMAKYPRVEMR